MKDPFEDFLEDAMSGPDLELGHEMRRRLLEAAVAGEALEQDNVVRMDRGDPEVQEGFNWILGETEATGPLMQRMIFDPAFLNDLDGERRFVRTLRHVLVKQANVVAPAARRRFLPAVALGAAAAVALAAGTLFFSPDEGNKVPVLAQAEVGSRSEKLAPAAAAPAIAPASPGEKSVEVAVVERPEAPAAENLPSGPSALIPEAPAGIVDEASAIAALTGNGQSVEPEDPVLVQGGGSSFSLHSIAAVAVGETDAPLQDSALTLLDSDSDSGSSPSFAFHSDRGAMWDVGFISGLPGSTGLDMSLIGGGRESTIPEPGPVLLVVIGTAGFLLRRRRKSDA
ncbi:PEP-CTERM sorting domain-containing protein [Luteolibacter luteus]|uniref:PEP-CTERM sorting domain-containing protein n=1 Tax=Luteolibacter luteus TaxID=2728835 RepID=A0A858RFS7_9BACT|nr:PEP-CTERM sorting domain-containing protein [Luteolibacter luteus]QJE95408.1 PEP-CTERM sorting domain-containing protein [Luteolibacter luteus]